VIGERRGHDLDVALEAQTADPFERGPHVASLRLELRVVAHMLPDAAAAAAEMRAGRGDPDGARLDDPRDAGAQLSPLLTRRGQLDAVAGGSAFDEDDATGRRARDAVAVGGEGGDEHARRRFG
jgi:hypothetical protein